MVEKLKEAKPRSTGGTPRAAAATKRSRAEAEIEEALAKLSDADRKLAVEQRFCPVLRDSRLGSMGTPIKLTIGGRPVFICCEGCQKRALADPQATLKALERRKSNDSISD